MAANSKTDAWESALLKLLFNNTDTATSSGPAIGDAGGLRGSATAGSLYVSLHTADPGEAPATQQTTSEISYTPYARIGVARSTAGWTVSVPSATQVVPFAAINFAQMTAGTGGNATYAGIGTLASGNGHLLYTGPISPAINIVNGVTPSLTTGSVITED